MNIDPYHVTKVINRNSNLGFSSDQHIGSMCFHEEGYNRFIDIILNKYDGIEPKHNYVKLGGDEVEGIHIDDPRFDGTANKTILDQIEYAVKKTEKIPKEQFIGRHIGNHEFSLWRKIGNATWDICKRTGTPYLGFDCIISYRDEYGELLFREYSTHGRWSFGHYDDDPEEEYLKRCRALKRNMCKMKMVDCVLHTCAHAHQILIKKPKKKFTLVTSDNDSTFREKYIDGYGWDGFGETRGVIDPNKRFYLCTGSFYKKYHTQPFSDDSPPIHSYSERYCHQPSQLGFTIVKVREGKIAGIDEVHV